MARNPFALFIDVMGVQQQLLQEGSEREGDRRFEQCREHLESFHQDLANMLERELPLLLAGSPSVPGPRFVAEFSDSAYIVGDKFATVAAAGVMMMRKALRHEYPLRGGIGVGSFSHETSGVRAGRSQQVWSTSSFLGAAIVTAYQAERSSAPGLRILIHPHVLQRNTEAFMGVYPIALPEAEVTDTATHELRTWQAIEADLAGGRLRDFRDQQHLTERASRHYDSTLAAYERFRTARKALPFITPALWL